MGRVLSWDIIPDKPFTDSQINKLQEIGKKYNSGKFEKVWSCENFWCDVYDFYPNWDDPKGVFNKGKDNQWDIINFMYDKLLKLNRNHAKTCRELRKEGYILFHNSNPKSEAHGFCKVQGNEFNSLLIYRALIEISKAIPNATINVRDEGEFLLCEVKLQNGKALPDLEKVREGIHWRAAITLLGREDVLKKLENLKGIDEKMLDDFGFDRGYGDSQLQYLDDDLRNLKIVLDRIKSEFPRDRVFCIYNVMNEKGFDPYLLTRANEVDINKYINYTMSPETMMDGFSGEGFGLSDPKDAVALGESMTNMIKKAFEVDDDCTVKVLGE